MSFDETREYFRFTGPARLSKAVHTLEGLLTGVASDGKVTTAELRTLDAWIREHAEFRDRHPFNELIPIVSEAVCNKWLSEEDRADLIWCCDKLKSDGGFYQDATADMQRLQGLLGGILADGVVDDDEVHALRKWIDDHTHLATLWPYTEIDAVLTFVLSDGKVDDDERTLLLELFQEYSGIECKPPSPRDNDTLSAIGGMCALDPEIQIQDRQFCFTGSSERWTRSTFETHIVNAGGFFSPRVSSKLDYLVVGGNGNPCWAYACYGRKVEAAMKLRRDGSQVLIVHEYDVWDAIEDLC
ncbi:NAD-dependent DNA ligase [Crateriforma conspicua]|uniref:DNA ligase n=1 Tax=Crateriforma conspicua TaxID=2527996 RepID=A0A5C6FZR4_9PLAN|nr:NAD-dependent DNA ligase [Crateriforma conspicua]TWU66483.1 DNA ligase [Crateriforma conspicua]